MKLYAKRVDIPPNALRVARTLSDLPGFGFLWDPTFRQPSYVACDPIARTSTLDPEPALALDPTANPLASVPRWLGLLPYESRRALERPAWSRPDSRSSPHLTEPLWFRYGAVVRIAEDVLVVGDDKSQVDRLATFIRRAPRDAQAVHATAPDTEPEARHIARIQRALELIVEGQIYQVNLARRFVFQLDGRSVDILERWGRFARAPYSGAFEFDGLSVVSSSPELLLSLDAHGRLVTQPIKGTLPRGTDAASDGAQRRNLDADPKERAELSMVIDVERNDLGRVAQTGTVRVRGAPRVETFGSVHHRVATIFAQLKPGVDRSTLLEAMLPSGSVTGAPKVRAMEVIAELESERRGLYTGGFGSLAHDGSLRLGMAIRTLTRAGTTAHYFAGGGIVLDSDPVREVSETGWKAVQVQRLLASPR